MESTAFHEYVAAGGEKILAKKLIAEKFCKTSWCWILFLVPTSEYWCSRCRLWGRTCRCRCSRRSRSPRTWTAPRPWSDASWRRWRSPHHLCSRQRWSDRLGSSRCWCSRLKQNKYSSLFKDLSLTLSHFRVLRISTKVFNYIFFSFYHRHQPEKAPCWTTIHTPVNRITFSPFSEWVLTRNALKSIDGFQVLQCINWFTCHLFHMDRGRQSSSEEAGCLVHSVSCRMC